MKSPNTRIAMFMAALLGMLAVSTEAAEVPISTRYFGLQPPTQPQPFEPPMWMRPGRVLTNLALAPGFGLAAFSVMDTDSSGKVAYVIHEARLEGAQWSTPVQAEVLGVGGEGAFSPDGRWFYLSSDRAPGGPMRPRAFRAAVRHGRFSPPELVKLDVPDDAGVYYPRQLATGELLFTSRGPVGRDDLFIAAPRGNGFARPEPLGGDFNSAKDDWDLVQTRDGSLRLWVSARDGGRGRTDIWYSRQASGQWSAARNLAGVNSEALETAPVLSPDDQVLFFLRRESGRERMYWVSMASTMEGR